MNIRRGEHLTGFPKHQELMRAFSELHKRGLLTSNTPERKRPRVASAENIVPIWTMEIPPGGQN